jgi:cystathionine beta-lyase/cystathionine gamma-synthase
MEKLSLLTINIINYLLNKNIEIVHPYLKNHISYNLALKYLNINIYPSTFLIGTDLNKIQLENILNQINLITVSVSFGSNITRIDKNIFNIENKNYLRLSIGYEETSELLIIKINELLKFLNL